MISVKGKGRLRLSRVLLFMLVFLGIILFSTVSMSSWDIGCDDLGDCNGAASCNGMGGVKGCLIKCADGGQIVCPIKN